MDGGNELSEELRIKNRIYLKSLDNLQVGCVCVCVCVCVYISMNGCGLKMCILFMLLPW